MENNKTSNVIKIDAKGKTLGRLASEVAFYLMGKNNPAYQRHNTDASSTVFVYNTDEIKVTGKKMKQKLYWRHSGYPGGIKSETLEKVMEKDSREAVKRAVYGMLPKNKLRERMLKKLKLYNKQIN